MATGLRAAALAAQSEPPTKGTGLRAAATKVVADGVDFGNPMFGRTMLGQVAQIGSDAAAFGARLGLPTEGISQTLSDAAGAIEPSPERGLAADVARGAASLPVFPLAFLSEGEQAAKAAEEHGATPGQALAVGSGVGAVSGALEAVLPLGVGKVLAKGAKTGLRAIAMNLFKGGVVESGTEGLQQVTQDAVPAYYEGDASKILDNVPRAMAVGAIVGGGVAAPATAVAGRVATATQPQAVGASSSSPSEPAAPGVPPSRDVQEASPVPAPPGPAEAQLPQSPAQAGAPLAERVRRPLAAARERIYRAADQGSLPAAAVAKAVRMLSYGGGASSEVSRLKAERAGQILNAASEVNAEFRQNLKVFGTLDAEQQLEAYRYLTGGSDGTTLPPEAVAQLDKARTNIDTLSRRIVDEVLPPPASASEEIDTLSALQQKISENLGSYVTRFYEADHVRGYNRLLRQTKPEVFDGAVAFIMEREGVDLDTATGTVEAMIARHTDPTAFRGPSEAGTRGIPQARFKPRDDIPAELRALLGEVKSPAVVVNKTIHDLSHIVAQFKYLEGLSKAADKRTGKPLFSEAPSSELGHTVQIGDAASNGALAGKWTTRETFDAIGDKPSMTGAVGEWLESYISRPFRKAKTVLNPATHVRNVAGNVAMGELANVSLLNPANWRFYKQAGAVFRDSKGALFKEAAEAGAMGSQMFADPAVEQGLRRMGQIIESSANPSVFRRRLEAGKLTVGRAGDTATHLYNAEDQIFRMASYLKRRAKGDTPQQAAEWTNRFFPDYNSNPELVQEFQKLPLAGPFLAFAAQMPRIAANAALYNPVKAGAVVAAYQGLVGGFTAWMDDDEKREDWEKAKLLLPPWAKGSVPVQAEGGLRTINVQNVFPFGGMIESPAPDAREMIWSGPVADVVSLLKNGTDSRGFQILAQNASPADRAAAAAKAVALGYVPTFVQYDVPRISKAISGEKDKYGRGQDLGPALGSLAGVRPESFHPDVLHYQRYYGLSRDLDFELRAPRDVVQNRTSSREAKAAARVQIKAIGEQFKVDVKELDDALFAAKRLGAKLTMPAEKTKVLLEDKKRAATKIRNLLR